MPASFRRAELAALARIHRHPFGSWSTVIAARIGEAGAHRIPMGEASSCAARARVSLSHEEVWSGEFRALSEVIAEYGPIAADLGNNIDCFRWDSMPLVFECQKANRHG